MSRLELDVSVLISSDELFVVDMMTFLATFLLFVIFPAFTFFNFFGLALHNELEEGCSPATEAVLVPMTNSDEDCF